MNNGLFSYSTLLLESLILFFFGAAWLIKGRALGHEGKIGEKLYRERKGLQLEIRNDQLAVEAPDEFPNCLASLLRLS